MKNYTASRFLTGFLIVAAVGLASIRGGSVQAASADTAPLAGSSAQGSGGFLSVWSRTDLPVAQGRVARSYVWGPTAISTRSEPWAESPGGQRQVQYWDKARMEITNPGADPNNPYYVTNGRIVYEMVGGLIQTGANRFETRPASQEPVAGDTRSANPEAPSYAAFRGAASILPGESQWVNRTNQPIVTYIDYRGAVGRIDYLAGYGAKYGYYVDPTKHNMADVFWGYLNQQGVVYKNGAYVTEPLFNWVDVTGYPITEPYWITARVGGQPYAMLVQLFERRVLTFAPGFPPDYRIQMGNVGQHYVAWRYRGGESPGVIPSLPALIESPTPAPAPPTAQPPTPVPPTATPVPPPPVPPNPPAPTQPPNSACASLPANVNSTVTPNCGPIGTVFDIIIRGFTPNEAITFVFTLPNGQVVQSSEPIQVTHPGVLLDELDSNLVRDYPGVIGVWQVVYRGVTSGNQATAYFQITP